MLLALAVSAAGVAPTAHAEDTYPAPTMGETDYGPQQPTEEEKLAIAKKQAEETKAADATWGFDWIMTKVMGLFAWLVGTAALTLNYAAYYTVVNMGKYVNDLSAVGLVWVILRDIGNILLIFGFLAIGISIIIDSSWYGGGQKLLPALLIAAVFINFSLFAAKAVIDVGNLFATQIYTQINQGTLPNPSDTGFSDIIQNKGIAGVLMNSLGLQAIYGQAKDGNTSVLVPGKAWYVGFMSIILFIVTAFVMFALAFILLARFVILLFLIILSPIGIAGYAVPKLESWASRWWSTLFQQTIAAPILFLLLYIALRVITDKHFLQLSGGTEPNWTGFLKEGENIPGFGGILLSFMVAIGLMLAVVIVAKSLSAFGAGWATKTAGKLSFGATAFAGRRTVGRLSNYSARQIRSGAWGKGLQASETGRLLAGVADRGAKSSFDVRGTSALKNLPGGGISAGEAQKGGYIGTEGKAIKAREDYAKSLKERKQTRSETQQLETIKASKENMGKLHETAKDEHKLTEAETIKLRAEVKRLENLSIKSPETDRALGAAQQKLATSETNLVAAITKLDEAAGNLKTWKNKETVAKEEVKAATSTNSARLAYGESLQKKTFMGVPRAPYDWTTVAGSARHEVAGKIIKDATKKKTKAEELVEEIEASIKKAAEEKQKGETKPEEPTKEPAKEPTP